MSNKDKLKNAGVLKRDDLPAAHQKVIDDLSNQEVKALIDIKTKLDQADATEGTPPVGGAPGFTTFLVY